MNPSRIKGRSSNNRFSIFLAQSDSHPENERVVVSKRRSNNKKNTSTATTNSNSSSSHKSRSPLKRALQQIRPKSRRRSSLSSVDTTIEETTQNLQLMHFLIDVCPEDCLPKILAFCGPQRTAALARVNRVWRDVISEEWTWRVLCEDLYKWSPGQPEPVSWKEYYRQNPVVPTDYPSINAALNAAAGNGSRKKPRQIKNARILVRPGRYDMADAVTIHATRRTLQVTVEALHLPFCTTAATTYATAAEQSGEDLSQVILVSKTRRRNEPLFRVLRGELVLQNVYLQHACMGIDIWNGNCAVQVQPVADETTTLSQPPGVSALAKAALKLKSVQVSSSSGRGIVATDGAFVSVQDSLVHGCAATGVYVGGAGSRAVLESVDVTENGTGNQRVGGIARGHSGIYIEQGIVSVTNCNVSNNSASGLSIISPDQAELRMNRTDVVLNGFNPIDLPIGNTSGVTVGSNCQVSAMGTAHARSSVLQRKILAEEKDADDS